MLCYFAGFGIKSQGERKEQFMSTTQTLREPKAKRLRGKPAPQKVVEVEEPLTARERFRRLGIRQAEWRKSQGLPEEDPMTMDEIVALCKEARAEMYAEEQEQKNAAGS
jgi:protein-tyrosine-phosphatase